MHYPRLSCAAILAVAGACGSALGQVFPAEVDLSTLNGADGFVIESIETFGKFGHSVSSAGDINGDGIDDVIIGAHDASGYFGECYVVFGGAGFGVGGSQLVNFLDGTDGFIIVNEINPDALHVGWSVSSAGDINGDGIDDIVIGAPGSGYSLGNVDQSAGETYVVFGAANIGAGGFLDLSTINGGNGFVINGVGLGIFGYDASGWSVSSAGDFNGDGVDDVIIGAYTVGPTPGFHHGESYVVFGGVGVGAGGSLDLSSLNGANGFAINGGVPLEWKGYSVSSAGDINGDGTDDIIIGAPGSYVNVSYEGKSYVVFGGAGVGAGGSLDLSTLNGGNGFVINGIDTDDGSGISVACAGDFSGDGIDDIIIGAPGIRLGGAPLSYSSGESYVVFGGPGVGAGGSLELSSLTGANGFVINGIDSQDLCGSSVSSAGDINGDGTDDIIIGAPYAFSFAPSFHDGECYVVYGGVGVGASGALDLSSLNGANGFIMRGVDWDDRCGTSVSSAGDFNGDGTGDIIIGAPYAEYDIWGVTGECYVVFGRPTCDGDANGDKVVDVNDISYVLFRLGGTPPDGDADGDGAIDVNDISFVLFRIHTPC